MTSVTEPPCSEFASAFGGIADMAGLAAGSTRSRMTTHKRHWRLAYAPPPKILAGRGKTTGSRPPLRCLSKARPVSMNSDKLTG